MATRNDITGDALVSRGASKAYLDNYDLIFRKGNPKEDKDGSTTEQPTQRHGESKDSSDTVDKCVAKSCA